MPKLSDSDNSKIKQCFEWIKSHTPSKEDFKRLFDNEDGIKSMFKTEELKEYASYIPLFFGMLKDSFTGAYKEIPVGTIAMIAGTLIYVLNTIDIIPDFIPALGLLDDAAMMALCIAAAKSDVDKYKAWKKNKEDLENGYKEI